MHRRCLVVLALCASSPVAAQPEPPPPPDVPDPQPPREIVPPGPDPGKPVVEVLADQVASARQEQARLTGQLAALAKKVEQLEKQSDLSRNAAELARAAVSRVPVAEQAAKHDEATKAERDAARIAIDLERARADQRRLVEELEAVKAAVLGTQDLLERQRELEIAFARGTVVVTEAQKVDALRLMYREQSSEALQQFTTARGGTLGVPAAGPIEGFQAGVDAELLDGRADAFAQLGGINVSPRVDADAFAELATFDLPRRTLMDTGESVLELPATKVSMMGLRARFRAYDMLLVRELESERCLTATAAVEAARRNRTEALRAAGDVVRECKRGGNLVGRTVVDLSIGVRILQRSALDEEVGKRSSGGAAELMLHLSRNRPTRTVAGSFGASGLWLRDARDRLGNLDLEFLDVKTVRLFGSLELRGSITANEHQALPRIGVYGAYTRGFWGDERQSWERHEAEVGAYVGGRFKKTFQGMIAARLLKPFGEEGTTFLVSVIPFGNTSPEDDGKPKSD